MAVLSSSHPAVRPGASLWFSVKSRAHGPTAFSVSERRSRLVLGEDFARVTKSGDRGRHAGIDRDLHEHLANFFLGHAVAQRAADMQLELVFAVERRQHGEVEHAAGLVRQSVTAPYRAPAIFGQELLERLDKRVARAQRLVDILLAKHRGTDRRAGFEGFLVHSGLSPPLPWLMIVTVDRRANTPRRPPPARDRPRSKSNNPSRPEPRR